MDITIVRVFTHLENYTGGEWSIDYLANLSDEEKNSLLYFKEDTYIGIENLEINTLYCLTTIHDDGTHEAWLNLSKKEVEKMFMIFSDDEKHYMLIHKMDEGIPFYEYFNENGEKNDKNI